MEDKFDVMLNWTEDTPTEPGLYLFKDPRKHPVYRTTLSKGKWQNAQNPEWLYCWPDPENQVAEKKGGTPAHELKGDWLGPIPWPDRTIYG